MAIQKKLPRKPTDIIYVALSLIQKWCPRLKEKDENKMIQLTESISTWLNDFKPSTRDILDNPHSPYARTPYECSHMNARTHVHSTPMSTSANLKIDEVITCASSSP